MVALKVLRPRHTRPPGHAPRGDGACSGRTRQRVHHHFRLALACAVAVGVAALASPLGARSDDAPADDDPCLSLLAVVNRPTIGTSPCSVKPGKVLLEAGYTNGASGDLHINLATAPQSVFRIGLPHDLEVDVTPPSENWQSTAGGVASAGTSDSGIGIKYEIGHHRRFAYAAGLNATFPTGSLSFTSGSPVYTLSFDESYALSRTVGLAASQYVISATGRNAAGGLTRFISFAPTVVVSQALGLDAQAYLEGYSAIPFTPGGGPRYFYDGGVQQAIANRVELDVEVGSNFATASSGHSHYVGFGLAILF